MMLEIPYLVREEETVRHELVVNREEALEATDYYAEDVLFCKVIHEWVPVKYTFPHFNYVEIVVTERHAVPEEAAVARLVRLAVSVFADDVLDRVELAAAMIRVDHDLLAADDLLLLSPIHQMILMDSVLLSLIVVLLLMLLLSAGTAREHRTRVKVIVALGLLGF